VLLRASELVLELRCNQPNAYKERPTPSFIEVKATLLNTYMSKGRTKILVVIIDET
jgi:hypothetical protein